MIDMDGGSASGRLGKTRGTFFDYVAIARLDHSTKHIFIVPGIMLCYLLRGVRTEHLALSIIGGLITAICIASANYVINEWLDREFDKFHPEKSKRTSVQRELQGPVVWLEWTVLLCVGLACAFANSKAMFVVAAVFALQGVFYNIPPMRTKNLAYLDVISESINNPLRLMIGWAMIDPTSLPPSSVILTYWAGGAFLMAAKRLSEYREISLSHGKELLARYRASFGRYSDTSLTISCFIYALFATFFITVFLMKYRIEYIVIVPIIMVLFAYYMIISLQPGSSAQKPERLFRERGLIALVLLLAVTFVLMTFVTVPALDGITGQRFILIQ